MTALQVPISRNTNKGDVILEMTKLEKEVIRMELQISELIRIVAHLNERLKKFEEETKYIELLSHVPFTQEIT